MADGEPSRLWLSRPVPHAGNPPTLQAGSPGPAPSSSLSASSLPWRPLRRYASLLRTLIAQELARRFAGSIVGLAWLVVQPGLIILTYWLVFSLLLKVPLLDGRVPFITAFLTAYLPWLAFQETLMASATSVTSNPHLVKKILFPLELLPMAQLGVALIAHLVILALFVVGLIAGGRPPTLYALQLPYAILALAVLALGLGWLVAALNVFARDIAQALSAILAIGFWLTPIVWPVSVIPEPYRWALELNPFSYVVHGYLSALVLNHGLWHEPLRAIRFWAVALGCLAVGLVAFRRLKHDFADLM